MRSYAIVPLFYFFRKTITVIVVIHSYYASLEYTYHFVNSFNDKNLQITIVISWNIRDKP